jgi:hypothetical protein
MTTLALPVYDPPQLAAALQERGLPGRRSKTAITRLRRQRARRREAPPARRPLAERARERALRLYTAEIVRRGGETEIKGRYGTARLGLAGRDNRGRLMLLRAEGYRDYGRRAGCHMALLAYLCGVDDSGRWAARVPGTVTSVGEALAWLTPAEAHRAKAAGRRVRRQGDVYAIETTQAHDTPTGWVGADQRRDPATGGWVTSHHWNAQTRYLTHPARGRAAAPGSEGSLPGPVRPAARVPDGPHPRQRQHPGRRRLRPRPHLQRST